MKNNNSGHDNRFLVGGIIIIIGILLLISNLGFLDAGLKNIIFSWPSLFILLGIISFLRMNFRSGIIFTSIGALFLYSRFYFLDFWMFWPVLLIVFGFVLLTKNHHSHSRRHNNPKYNNGDWKWEQVNTDIIDESSVFSGCRKNISSENFQGGKITSIFGGNELNFANCRLAPGNNVIDILAVFGGTTLYLPDDWKIITDITPLFGGFSDKRRNYSAQNYSGDKTLIIKGTFIFGGGEIKSA
ncbi:MAG: LiaF transmembrane domain-containing protein [Bacillota bacterium]